ncbi:MAG: ATP-binding cassette domain-containing protein [Sedimentisphaerales bacterium]|nr:ATP-binding cassette domain-containing protein [Sedimentisphaerales bacterium]
MNANILLNVENLKTWFPIKKGLLRKTVGHVKAVDDISFQIPPGSTFGLVGESGSGKTTAARTVARLVPATGGKAYFNGENILPLKQSQLRRIRKDISMVFQDPYSSLNPRMTVGSIIAEPLKVHKIASGSQLIDRIATLLEKVGLSPSYINRYPHEFSGGQRQRIGVARALALEPKLVICDEPVSALDVSIQSQILNLLKDIQDQFNLTYLFIAHDLSVVEFISDIVAVMYLGKIVEIASADALYENPLHPYTKLLLSAIPHPVPGRKKIAIASAEPEPKPVAGCPFYGRCPIGDDFCTKNAPSLTEKDPGHKVACFKVS